jgi:hypothetical protein
MAKDKNNIATRLKNIESPSLLSLPHDLLRSVLCAAYGSGPGRAQFIGTCRAAARMPNVWGHTLTVRGTDIAQGHAPPAFFDRLDGVRSISWSAGGRGEEGGGQDMGLFADLKSLRSLRLHGRQDISTLKLPASLRSLSLRGSFGVSLHGLVTPGLRTLRLSRVELAHGEWWFPHPGGPDIASATASAPALTEITIHNCLFDELRFAKNFAPRLEKLDIGGLELPIVDLHHLQGLPLRTLIVDRCWGVNNSSLADIRNLPLTRLDLGQTRISDEGLLHLRDMPLVRLDLSVTAVGDAGLAHLVRLPLEHLTLAATRVTGAGLAHLRDMPLTYLSLRNASKLGDGQELAHLRATPLRHLDLSSTKIEGDALQHLAGLPLTHLGLAATRIGGDALRHLARMPLTHLDLAFTGVDNGALEHLSAMPPLSELSLPYSRVTWAAIRELRSLPALRCLDIRGVSEDATLAEILAVFKGFNVVRCERIDARFLAKAMSECGQRPVVIVGV